MINNIIGKAYALGSTSQFLLIPEALVLNIYFE